MTKGAQNKFECAVTFGSGFVFDYSGPGSYAGKFVDVSVSAPYSGCNMGVDYCTSPDNLNGKNTSQKGASALLLTTSVSLTLDFQSGPTFAYDYYWQLAG